MKGLSFTVDGELYAVDVTLVQKVARRLAFTPVPSSPGEVIGIANLKGRVVTVLSLNRLLGICDSGDTGRYVNTIVFKSHSGAEDQMGLAIDKPGNLIYFDSDAIRSPPITDTVQNHHISGVTEIDEVFYRIVDIESILKNYTHGSEIISANSSFGGTENE